MRTAGAVLIVAVKAVRRSGLTAPARFTLLSLAGYCGGDGRTWVSSATLVQSTGLPRRTLFRALAELDEGGWIRRESRRRDRQTTVITLVLEKLDSASQALSEPALSAPQALRPPSDSAKPEPLSAPQALPQCQTCTSLSAPQAHRRSSETEGLSEGQREKGETPAASGPSSTPGTGPAPAARPTSRSPVTAIVDHYTVEFTRARGEAPSRGQDRYARELLEKLDGNVERACARIGNAFAHDFWRTQVTLAKIAREPDAFASKPQPRNGAARVQRDPPGTVPCWTPSTPLTADEDPWQPR